MKEKKCTCKGVFGYGTCIKCGGTHFRSDETPREPKEILEEFRLTEWIMTNDKNDDNQQIENRLRQTLSALDSYYASKRGRELPVKHLVYKQVNGKITELFIEGEEWIPASKRLSVEEVEKMFREIMRWEWFNNGLDIDAWNDLAKRLAQSIIKAQEEKK